jgi:hypothetical protein
MKNKPGCNNRLSFLLYKKVFSNLSRDVFFLLYRGILFLGVAAWHEMSTALAEEFNKAGDSSYSLFLSPIRNSLL